MTGALSMAKRRYPTSKIRSRSLEDPMPKGRQPRGVSPRPRSGAVAESARLQRRRNGREELPKSEVRGGSREELPHVRGQGRRREDQPHVQGAVAARAQDGLENLSHIEDQEGRR